MESFGIKTSYPLLYLQRIAYRICQSQIGDEDEENEKDEFLHR